MNLALAKALDRVAGGAIARVVSAADATASLFRQPPPPIERVETILVIKFWGLGNWALLRPIVADLRSRYASARFLAVTLESNRPLVTDAFDRAFYVRPRGLAVVAADLARTVTALRRESPHLSLDFEQFSTTGALLARAAGVPQRIGFSSRARGRDGLLTVRVPFRRDEHASRSFRKLAEAAGVPREPYAAGGLAPSEGGLAEAERLLGPLEASPERARPLVVLHPGSGDNFPGRRWSAAGFSAVGRHAIERHGALVVVTGSASEAELASAVAAGAGAGAIALAGRLSLDGLVALLSRSSVLVSNDTGPVHLASALKRPVLALFGPNTPTLYGPLGDRSTSFWKALPCSPCLTTDNYRSSRCRIHTCMASIPTGEVTTALDALLGRASPRVAAGQAHRTRGPQETCGPLETRGLSCDA